MSTQRFPVKMCASIKRCVSQFRNKFALNGKAIKVGIQNTNSRTANHVAKILVKAKITKNCIEYHINIH